MALARVVTFEGINAEQMAARAREMEAGEPPAGLPASELMILHDPEADRAVAIVFFDNEEDYQKGHEILDAMPASDTPGTRVSVTKHEVVTRMKTS